MGNLVRFPGCREIAPEVSRLIARRTKKAAYWVRRWSKINRRLFEADPEDRDEKVLEEASQYVTDWLYAHNRAALKARGF